MLLKFSKLSCELRAQISESTWEPREVTVKRYINARNSSLNCSGKQMSSFERAVVSETNFSTRIRSCSMNGTVRRTFRPSDGT